MEPCSACILAEPPEAPEKEPAAEEAPDDAAPEAATDVVVSVEVDDVVERARPFRLLRLLLKVGEGVLPPRSGGQTDTLEQTDGPTPAVLCNTRSRATIKRVQIDRHAL